VAKNDMFINLANGIAKHVALGGEKSPDPEKVRGAMESQMTEVYGKLRETMNLGKCSKVSGESLACYVHHDGKSGVMIAMKGKPQDVELGRNLAMHAASIKPVAANREDVPADQVNKVREEARVQAKAEGKPDPIVDKIAEGKVSAFYAQCVLMEQEHVRSDVYGAKTKVKDVLAKGGVTGVTEMVYMVVGG
jgi:elongation factor Ts